MPSADGVVIVERWFTEDGDRGTGPIAFGTVFEIAFSPAFIVAFSGIDWGWNRSSRRLGWLWVEHRAAFNGVKARLRNPYADGAFNFLM